MAARAALAALAFVCWGSQALAAKSSAAPADTSGARSAVRLYRSGQEAFDRGDYARSIDYMLEVLLYNPNDMRAKSYLSAAARKVRDSRLAQTQGSIRREIEEAEGVVTGGRSDAERWDRNLAAAREFEASGEWLAACDRYLRVLDENPKHADARQGLVAVRSRIAARLDDQLFHDVKEAHLYKAFFQYMSSQKAKAREEFQKALELPQIFSELSRADIQRYVDLLAEKPAGRGGAAAEGGRNLLSRLGRKLLGRPAAAPAKPAPDQALLVKQRAQSLSDQAAIAYKEGRLEEAVHLYMQLLALQPDFPGAQEAAFLASQDYRRMQERLKGEGEQHYQSGLALYAAGRLDDARKEWEKAVAADPGHPYALRAIGRVQRDLKERQP